eukprot:maker-scaffold_4-snap-gene-14.10-mRNA-1 protein AED:0.07 eAED:0.14 QI:0/0/0/1/1/1/3/0/261
MDQIISFLAGASYGFTSVLVGQPLDTCKLETCLAKSQVLFLLGDTCLKQKGTLFRSAQFGVNDVALTSIRSLRGGVSFFDKESDVSPLTKDQKFFGIFDHEVILAGFCGGIGRGLVEAPFEYIKVRKQVDHTWRFRNLYDGSGITIFRNSFLFMFFMVYIDLSKVVVPGGLSPFLTGAVCANLAWLSVWPLDVLKSRVQSGNYENLRRRKGGVSTMGLNVFKEGKIFRGVIPGLLRSSIANGCGMSVYVRVKEICDGLVKE